MPQLKAQVRHDAASLLGFVDSIARLCEQRNPAAAYLPSTERFIEYIAALASQTKAHLRSYRDTLTDTSDFVDFRRDIAALRAGWRWLHTFIKPALDADTLNLPAALLHGMLNRLHQIPKYSKTDFVIYHTDVFNYLQVQLTKFMPMANKVAALVQGPAFPPDLGLIGIPYSQSSTLFVNCLIPHEMGHFVFGDQNLRSKFLKLFERELLKSRAISDDALEPSRYSDILSKWAEELFCDLFAIRLLGPCYTFAYVELYDICKVLNPNGGIDRQEWAQELEFNDFYPPDLFRIRAHVQLLDSDGWWSEVRKVDSHYVSCLAAITKLGDRSFVYPTHNAALRIFLRHVRTIQDELDSLTEDLKPAFQFWQAHYGDIEPYLQYGVVPSSIRPRGRSSRTLPEYYPDPITLINAAYRFYIESLDLLLSKIKGAKLDRVEHRSSWASKLQSWTSKAMEDFTFREEALRTNGSNLKTRYTGTPKVAHKQSKKLSDNASAKRK